MDRKREESWNCLHQFRLHCWCSMVDSLISESDLYLAASRDWCCICWFILSASVRPSSWAKKNLSHRSDVAANLKGTFICTAKLWCAEWWTLPPVIERNFSSTLFQKFLLCANVSAAPLFALMMMAPHLFRPCSAQSDIADHIRWVNNAIKY